MVAYAPLPTAESQLNDNDGIQSRQGSALSATSTSAVLQGDTEAQFQEEHRRLVVENTLTASPAVSPCDELPAQRPETHRASTRWSSASTILAVDAGSLKHSFSPATHEDKQPLNTARPFIYTRQLGRLARLTIGEWLITTFLCGMLGLTLRLYEKRDQLDFKERHRFNSYTTLLALLLGINLAASLRSYAKLLRWRLLSFTYRPLRTFDLVLGCESLFNVLELVWTARVEAETFPFRYFPSWTQILGVSWLAANLCMTLFVGMLGLNYNLDSVDVSDLTAPGTAHLPNLASVLEDSYYRSLDFMQARGSGAADLRFYYEPSIAYNTSQLSDRYTALNNGTSQYYLYAYDDSFEVSAVSRVFIRNDVICDQYAVTDGVYGVENWFIYIDSAGQPVNISYPSLAVGPRGIMAMSNMNSSCGDRCTEINVFRAGVDPNYSTEDVYDAYYFRCNSTVSPISRLSLDEKTITHPQNLALPDDVSRILAGSLGWSSFPFDRSPSDTFTYQSYSNYSNVFFRAEADDVCDWEGEIKCPTLLQQMQHFISSFNMGAIVAACSGGYQGLSYYDVFLEDGPRKSLKLSITWRWTIVLLAGIPCGQLIALIIVLLLANNTIIRDDSHLAIAKLYYSLFKKYDLGERGSILRTEELVELMDTKVAYTWRDLPERSHKGQPVGRVDVYEQPLYRFKFKSDRKVLRTRPEYNKFPLDKYYD